MNKTMVGTPDPTPRSGFLWWVATGVHTVSATTSGVLVTGALTATNSGNYAGFRWI